jgi:hypothetical protein
VGGLLEARKEIKVEALWKGRKGDGVGGKERRPFMAIEFVMRREDEIAVEDDDIFFLLQLFLL